MIDKEMSEYAQLRTLQSGELTFTLTGPDNTLIDRLLRLCAEAQAAGLSVTTKPKRTN